MDNATHAKKVALVTGASAGIGKAAGVALVNRRQR